MLGENIKTLRSKKGFTQEELAVRLHVVRQTVSKWEKNLSVPDADLLQRLAEVLDCPVGELLGAAPVEEADRNELAEQLARINEQLAVHNRRARRIWTVVAVVLALAVLVPLLFLLPLRAAYSHTERLTTQVALSDDPAHTPDAVDAGFEAVRKTLRQHYRGCSVTEMRYDEERAAALEAEWSARLGGAEVLVVESDLRTGDGAAVEGLAPGTVCRNFSWVLSRQGGAWAVVDMGPGLLPEA